jgi:mono/diheme cytochrome c family protein
MLAETIGCVACHSADGTTEGKVGPTWKKLFGAKRLFADGTTEIADELYIRDKILDPQQKKIKAGQVEMPSYKGVLTEVQIESMVLYIKSLAGRPGRDE